MRNYLKSILLFCAAVALFSASAAAWDDTGHKTSAFIAWQVMSPEARSEAIDILMKAPEDSHLSVYYNAYESRSETAKKLDLFMIAATWSDIVKNRAFKTRYANYHKGDWHYADFFWKHEDGKAEILKDFPEESGKAVPKLYEIEKLLRSDTASGAEKAVALAWFLHIGGDLHNPLHNASRVTDLEPKGDQGGNMFYLTPKDAERRMNLHSFWDSVISRNMPREADACDSDYISEIAGQIMDKYPFSKAKDSLALGDYRAWNREGFSLLPTEVYADSLTRGEMPPEIYEKSSFAVGQEQVALAGYRLGETLNRIFGGKMSNNSANSNAANCRIIRRVLYPVSKKRLPEQKMRHALLDICPENKGMVARPLITVFIEGKPVQHEFDVVKVFETEAEAKKFAEDNSVKDADYN